MTKKELKEAVKKAYKNMNEWNVLSRSHYTVLMYNKANGNIWADCFLSENDWREYVDPNATPIPLLILIRAHTEDHKLTNNEVIEIITDYITKGLNFIIEDTE